MVLPRVEQDNRLPLRHATVDLVGIDGQVSDGERRPPRITRELCDTDEGARRIARRAVRCRHLGDCAKGGEGLRSALGGQVQRALTARYHEIRTADEDGDDGRGCGEDWE
jgi:hypothetical protein